MIFLQHLSISDSRVRKFIPRDLEIIVQPWMI